MRPRRLTAFLLSAPFHAANLLAVLIVTAWLLGRVASDRVLLTQWMLWIPTPALLGAVLLGLLGSVGPGPRPRWQRRRVRAWLAVFLLVGAHFTMLEHRLLRRPPDASGGIAIVHWNMSYPNAEHHGDFLIPVVLDMLADITVLVDARDLRFNRKFHEAIPEHASVFNRGKTTLVSMLPVIEARVVVAGKAGSVELFRFEGRPGEREIVLYVVDMPSDPRRSRWEIAATLREQLDGVGAPEPDLVAGDFNIPRGSRSLRLLFPHMHHAYERGGHGYGASFHRELTGAHRPGPGAGDARHRGDHAMTQIIVKLAITTVLVVVVSETARHSSFVGGLIASLPIVSILAMIWLYADTKDAAKVAALSTSVFWLVLPSLALFLVLPALLKRNVDFTVSMVVACVVTIACYGVMVFGLGKAGVKL
jgi:F0F1-type ATP synthase assembly protein I